MKIKDALHDVYQLLIETEKLIEPQAKNASLQYYTIRFVNSYTLNRLKEIFFNYGHFEASATTLNPFRTLLKDRWYVIKGSEFQYCYTDKHPITLLCLKLAKKLSSKTEHPFQILMPTISIQNNVMQMTLIEDEEGLPEEKKLQLNQFILDDEGHVINILDALNYSIDDSVLKHTSLLQDNYRRQQVLLSSQEVHCVTNHSQEAKNLYSAVKRLEEIRNESMTYGAVVDRLIKKLRMSGEHGQNGGRTNAASGYAYEGIVEFSNYLMLLTEDEIAKLLALRSDGNSNGNTFGECWFRLAYDSSILGLIIFSASELVYNPFTPTLAKPNSPCVEQVSSDFERMIKNSELKNELPTHFQDIYQDTVESALLNIFNQQKKFSDALTNKTYTVLPYNIGAPQQNEFRIRAYRKLLSNAADLRDQLNKLHTIYHSDVLLNIIMKTALKKIASTFNSILQLMEIKFAPTKKVILDLLGYDYLKTKIITAENLKKLLQNLPPDFHPEVINKFGSLDQLIPDYTSLMVFKQGLNLNFAARTLLPVRHLRIPSQSVVPLSFLNNDSSGKGKKNKRTDDNIGGQIQEIDFDENLPLLVKKTRR